MTCSINFVLNVIYSIKLGALTTRQIFGIEMLGKPKGFVFLYKYMRVRCRRGLLSKAIFESIL